MLTSETEAYFSSASKVSGTIQAGTWQEEWDKSSLKFLGNKAKEVKSCETIEIAVSLSNGGSDMKGSTHYEVYYSERGNPKEGQKLGEGEIQAIPSEGVIKLEFMADKPGNYKFRALQREGHGNKYDSRHELWSDTIMVVCSNNKTQNVEEKAEQMNESKKNEEVKVEQKGVEQEPNKQQENESEQQKIQNPDPSEVEVKGEDSENSSDNFKAPTSENQNGESKSLETDVIKNDSSTETEGGNNED